MMLQALRTGTRDLHQDIETRLDLVNRVQNLPEYARLLHRFYGFFFVVEHALLNSAWPGDFDIQPRLKTPLLKQDLSQLSQRLGYSRDIDLPSQDDLPPLGTLPERLGVLYVLEGATLSGQVLSLHFAKKLGLGSDNGLAFYRGYGDRTAERWKAFCAYLETQASGWSEAEQAAAIGSAERTIAALAAWLLVEESSEELSPDLGAADSLIELN